MSEVNYLPTLFTPSSHSTQNLLTPLLLLSAIALAGCGGADPQRLGEAASLSATRSCASVSAQTNDAEAERQFRAVHHEEVRARRFLVKSRTSPETAIQAAMTYASSSGAETSEASPAHVEPVATDLYGIDVGREATSAEVASMLDAQDFEYIEPDHEVHAVAPVAEPAGPAGGDAMLGQQWAHAAVQSASAWTISRGSSRVIVAVLDSGVDVTHPDLAANVWTNPGIGADGQDRDGNGFLGDLHGWNFVAGNGNVQADDARSFHGTHVAGTIGAIGGNGLGISGHAPRVTLLPVKFIGKSGSGFTSDAIRGIDYAIAKGARIINNSWGSSSAGSRALSDAIGRARAAGVLFIAAAGNDGADTDAKAFYPAGYPHDNIVRVAATDRADRLAGFSNFGARSVDLAAPGVSILSTKNGGAYQYLSGTSMATPLVAGVLATMAAARPDLGYRDLRRALLQSVDSVPDLRGRVSTGGRLNAFRALTTVRQMSAEAGSSDCG